MEQTHSKQPGFHRPVPGSQEAMGTSFLKPKGMEVNNLNGHRRGILFGVFMKTFDQLRLSV